MMSDTISRQQAIDALNQQAETMRGWSERYAEQRKGILTAVNIVEDLPAAQPEPHYDEWCDSCKEYDKEKHSCPRWNKVIKNTVEELKSAQPEPCEDAVSRKAVQYLLAHFVDEDKYVDACDGLKHLPPVTPKQRTGKWLWQTGKVKCNQCLRAIRRIDHDGLLNFCPHCGAKMEGDAE